jgi:hypothetical protein
MHSLPPGYDPVVRMEVRCVVAAVVADGGGPSPSSLRASTSPAKGG